MGNRAIYQILENGESAVLTSHNGANALSLLLRLAQAKKIQAGLTESQTIARIFTHLGDDGQYHNPRLPDEDMFCVPVKPEQRPPFRKVTTITADMKCTSPSTSITTTASFPITQTARGIAPWAVCRFP